MMTYCRVCKMLLFMFCVLFTFCTFIFREEYFDQPSLNERLWTFITEGKSAPIRDNNNNNLYTQHLLCIACHSSLRSNTLV
jgi:hypothetical protein